MSKIISKNYIRVPKEEYMRLKALQDHFEIFWNYMKHLKDIDEARKEIHKGKTISQERLFRTLGLQ